MIGSGDDDLPPESRRADMTTEASSARIRVFLLDDHQVVREGIRSLLETDGGLEVVGEAGTAEEALARIPTARPTVAVLDVRLPDGSGVEVCREVRSRHPEVACLMLTSFADDEALFDAIMAGASGYVLKEVGGSDLVGDIRKVASGHSLLDPRLTARVMERIRTRRDSERQEHLTPQEERILEHISEGLTNRQIAEQMYLSEKTVKNYVSNLLAKLGMSRRTEAAVYAVRRNEHRGDQRG
jgi:two-component system response regulator DevR